MAVLVLVSYTYLLNYFPINWVHPGKFRSVDKLATPNQQLSSCGNTFAVRLNIYEWMFCSDDKPSDLQPKRHRHMRVFLDAVGRCCRSGRHSYVTWQRLWPVRVSCMANESPALVLSQRIELQHSTHGMGTLPCCHLSRLVPQQRMFLYDVNISVLIHYFKYRYHKLQIAMAS